MGEFIQKFYELIESGAINEAIELIEVAKPSVRIKQFCLAIVMVRLQRIAGAYQQLLEACDGDCQERMIAEAIAALAVKLGKFSDSVFYAKFATTLPIGEIKKLPSFFGSFGQNIHHFEQPDLEISVIRSLLSGQWDAARKSLENIVQLDPDRLDNWHNLVKMSLMAGHRYSAAIAGLYLGRHSEEEADLDCAWQGILAGNLISDLDDNLLTKLSDQQFLSLQSHLNRQQDFQHFMKKAIKAKRRDSPLTKPLGQVSQLFSKRLHPPLTDKKLYARWKRFEDQRVQRLNLLIVTNYSRQNLAAAAILDVCVQYQTMRAQISVLNDSPFHESDGALMMNLFKNWRQCDAIDNETLARIIFNNQPDIILDLRDRQCSLGRQGIFSEVADVPRIHFYQYLNAAAEFFESDATLRSCLIPTSLIANHAKFETLRDEKIIILPADPYILTSSLIDQLLDELPSDYRLGLIDKADNAEIYYSLAKSLTSPRADDFLLIKDNRENYRQLIFDIDGQEHYLLSLLAKGLIPDLLAVLPRKRGRKASLVIALYQQLGLATRIGHHIYDIIAMPPLDEALIHYVNQAIVDLSQSHYRKIAGMEFASQLWHHVKASREAKLRPHSPRAQHKRASVS